MEFSNRVLEIFKELNTIPRGSGHMEQIAEFCMSFANKHNLKCEKDSANNVIIYKDATPSMKNSHPVILQGHLDMVWQKTEDCQIDFLKDPIETFVDGDFLRANKTTLGADNGIAVSIIMAILESNDLEHPPIEAVFTTDEEVGMLGAVKLDTSNLKSKRMINLDSEEEDTVTVSCAGGSEFSLNAPFERVKVRGTKISVNLTGLQGGHSGVEIHKGRQNATLLAVRILNHLYQKFDFDLISLNAGDKSNAIPNNATFEIVTSTPTELVEELKDYLVTVKKELSFREPNFEYNVITWQSGDFFTLPEKTKNDLFQFLVSAPNGVITNSCEIENLVETSLNLGVFKTDETEMNLCFSLRSNKESAIKYLEEKLVTLSKCIDCTTKISGSYPAWEYRDNSPLRKMYEESYKEQFSKEPKIEAIHAGLECGVFASKIPDLDCIAIGPTLFDVHTTKERMCISSLENFCKLLLNFLKKL